MAQNLGYVSNDYLVLMLEACSNISFGSKCLCVIKTVHNLGREQEEKEEVAEIPLYSSRTWFQCCMSSVYVLSLMIILFFNSRKTLISYFLKVPLQRLLKGT